MRTYTYMGYTLKYFNKGWHVGTIQVDGSWKEQGNKEGYPNLTTAKFDCRCHFGRI